MKILIIEDDDDKLRALQEFLKQEFEDVQVKIARSFGSGLRQAISLNGIVDAILLDISMPNYDVSREEPSGGNPEPFAGRELLAQMKLRGIMTPAIVVTMFDSFGGTDAKISLAQLMEQLKQEYSPPYVETVFFDSRQEGWRTSLLEIMKKVVKGIVK